MTLDEELINGLDLELQSIALRTAQESGNQLDHIGSG